MNEIDESKLCVAAKVEVGGQEYFVQSLDRQFKEVSLTLPKKDGSMPKKRLYCSKVGYFTPFSRIEKIIFGKR